MSVTVSSTDEGYQAPAAPIVSTPASRANTDPVVPPETTHGQSTPAKDNATPEPPPPERPYLTYGLVAATVLGAFLYLHIAGGRP